MKPINRFAVLVVIFSLNNGVSQATETAATQSSSYFAKANETLLNSNSLETQSRSTILNANLTRKKISELRAKARTLKSENTQAEMISEADQLAEQLIQQQENGARWRVESIEQLRKATELMQRGLVIEFAPWIKNSNPLTMDKHALDYISHNARIRSVHPTMLNKMGSEAEQKSSLGINTNMTLQVPALMAQNAPPDLDIGGFQLSHEQQYFSHIEVHNFDNQELSNVSQIPLNKMHQWRLILTDTQGNPVVNAQIEVQGHMPGHVHGLPTQPRVTGSLDNGVYLVDGLKFQMQGWWVIQFNILTEANSNDSAGQSGPEQFSADSVTFNLIL